LAAFGFSLKAVLVKLAYAQPTHMPVEPITMLVLRLVFAVPIFCFIAMREARNVTALSRRDWAELVILGLLGYYGAVILDFMGLRYISAGLERLIAFTYPTFTVLLCAFFFGKRIEKRVWQALLLCYLGVVTAFSHDLRLSADTAEIWIGSALVLGSSLMFALYLVGGDRMIQRIGASLFTALAMLVSTVATAIHFVITQPLSSLLQPWPIYGIGAALSLFSTVLPVFALSLAIRHIGAGRAAMIGCVGPLLTIFFGYWLLDEAITPVQVVGALLVIAGVLVVGR
jgi:drug/metabolite transporter (DMT)-like permease